MAGGKAHLIRVPFEMGCIVVNTLNYQFCQILQHTCNLARQRTAMFGRKKVLETDGNRPTVLEEASTHQHNATEKLLVVSRISTNKPMSESIWEQAWLGACLISICYCKDTSTIENADKNTVPEQNTSCYPKHIAPLFKP